jgi:hypothetical protein
MGFVIIVVIVLSVIAIGVALWHAFIRNETDHH